MAAAFPAAALAKKPGGKGVQEFTHVFTAGFPVFTFDPPSRTTLVTIPTGGFYSQQWTFGEHLGRTWTRPATS